MKRISVALIFALALLAAPSLAQKKDPGGPVTGSLKQVERTWRIQMFLEAGSAPTWEFFREGAWHDDSGSVAFLAGDRNIPVVRRDVSTILDKQVTLGGGKTLTVAEINEALAKLADALRQEDGEKPDALPLPR